MRDGNDGFVSVRGNTNPGLAKEFSKTDATRKDVSFMKTPRPDAKLV